MRRHSMCPTCTCEDVLATWAAKHLIPTEGTNAFMYQVTLDFAASHRDMLLTQKALTGRLRALGYPIQTKQTVAQVIGYRLAS